MPISVNKTQEEHNKHLLNKWMYGFITFWFAQILHYRLHLFTCNLLLIFLKNFKREFIFPKQLPKQLSKVTNRMFLRIDMFSGHLEKPGI